MAELTPCPHCGHEVSAIRPPTLCPNCGEEFAAALAGAQASGPQAPPVQPPPPPGQSLGSRLDDAAEEDAIEEVVWDKRGREEGDMDMTPMVDVTFLLLIFFMITAAFSLQKSIEIPKPEETDEPSTQVTEVEEQPEDTITVIVDQFNTFRVITADTEEEAPSKHDLLRKIRHARESAPAGSVPSKLVVKAHGDARHDRVVMALDMGVEAGMEQVQLITVEEDL